MSGSTGWPRKWRIYKAPGQMLETLPGGKTVPGHGGCVEGPDTDGEWIDVVPASRRRELEEALAGLVGWFEENDDRASDFGELFEVVAGRSALARHRAYEDGDTIVLGPEIFAAKDGSVICWKGENYVPRAEVDEESAVRTAVAMALVQDRPPQGDVDAMVEAIMRPILPNLSKGLDRERATDVLVNALLGMELRHSDGDPLVDSDHLTKVCAQIVDEMKTGSREPSPTEKDRAVEAVAAEHPWGFPRERRAQIAREVIDAYEAHLRGER